MSMKEISVEFFDSNSNFQDLIPFKIYKLEREMSGEIYHSHEYMQIWYVCRGIIEHWIGGKAHEMLKGDVFVIPPYISHKIGFKNVDEVKLVGCEFSSDFINDQFEDFYIYQDVFDFAYLQPFLVSEENIKPKLNLSAKAQADVEFILDSMLEEYETKEKYYDLVIKGDLLKFLSIIAREYNKSYVNNEINSESRQLIDKYRENILDSIEYIDDNYSKDIQLDDVCQHSMMSKTYFCYIFKNLTGKTFTQYLIDIRINRSIDMLSDTDMSITDICYQVGFNDLSHFCRTFKRQVGVSPGYYRKAVLEIDVETD